jgi:RNA polymerase sigma-54 factor
MRIDAGQHLRMSQQMKLAPRMIQSMEILQMAQAALEERLEQELASNPTLELREPGSDRDQVAAELQQEARDDREGERPMIVGEESSNGTATQDGKAADDFERLTNLAEEYGEAWASNTYDDYDYRPRTGSASSDGERDRKLDALANTAARGASLFDQLMDQWRLIELPDAIRRAGEHLIGFVDADGYIRTDEPTLLAQLPQGLTADDMRTAWAVMKELLDPPGIGARDLRECLLIQIDRLGAPRLGRFSGRATAPDSDDTPDLTLERELVAHHLKDIEANRLPRIAKTLDRPVEDIKRALLNLRQFQPHPGRELASETPRTITPDAIIEYDEENDTYTATLTNGRLPNVSINPAYRRMLKNAAVDKRTREFVGNNLRSARWLLDAIRQRESTLLRVINVVLQAQRDYFDQGPQALKPLPMTLVADQLGIHVATVSRAVNEKYLQTPRGIVPLRMFFSGGTETDAGESMSWAAVQAKLEQLIEEEDKQTPLSDDQLVDELKKHGIEIARRTVAKYRKQLNIPPARQRKEF